MRQYKITSPAGQTQWNILDSTGEENLKLFINAAIENEVQFTIAFRTI